MSYLDHLRAQVPGHPSLEDCPDQECPVCGIRSCPHGDPMHFHHDGCPSCFEYKPDPETVSRTVIPHKPPVGLWHNRPIVVLYEQDGRQVHFHGLWAGPEGMQPEWAQNDLDHALGLVIGADPDEWSYDDLFAELKHRGWEEVPFVEWWEPHK